MAKSITLTQAIDRANAAQFWREKLGSEERDHLVGSIASTFNQPAAYADTFALSPAEVKQGIVLFTGERATSASARHIAGEESCRALRILGKLNSSAKAALDQSTAALAQRLKRAEADQDHRMGGSAGLFCCGRCSVSVWRHVLAGGFDRRQERLNAAVESLKKFRDGKGKWQYFPFWYTLSALAEMDAAIARTEIKYAMPLLQRAAARHRIQSEYDRRRKEIARRALDRI